MRHLGYALQLLIHLHMHEIYNLREPKLAPYIVDLYLHLHLPQVTAIVVIGVQVYCSKTCFFGNGPLQIDQTEMAVFEQPVAWLRVNMENASIVQGFASRYDAGSGCQRRAQPSYSPCGVIDRYSVHGYTSVDL